MTRKKVWDFRKEQPVSTWLQCIPKEFPQIKKQQKIIKSLLESPDFNRSIVELRKRFKVKPGELRNLINQLIEADRQKDSLKIKLIGKKITQYHGKIKHKEIIKLLERFELSPLWFNPIYQYLIQDELIPIEIKCDVIAAEDKYGRDRLFIEVFVDTILEDIKEAWGRIIWHQKQLPDYWRKTIRNHKNQRIHADILKWSASGKSNTEICEQLLPERYPDYTPNLETIRKIKQRGKRDIKKLS